MRTQPRTVLAFAVAISLAVGLAAGAPARARTASPTPSPLPTPMAEPTATEAPAAAAAPPRAITVTGVGFAPVGEPERKTFAVYARTVTSGDDPGPARAALAAKLAELRAALERGGIAPSAIIQLSARVDPVPDGWSGWGALQATAKDQRELESALASVKAASPEMIDTSMPYRTVRSDVAPGGAVSIALDEAFAHATTVALAALRDGASLGPMLASTVAEPDLTCCPQSWRVKVTVTYAVR